MFQIYFDEGIIINRWYY